MHTGSEAKTQLPKFKYANPNEEVNPIEGNNIKRLQGSFNFKFAYEPLNNRVLIKVQEYAKRVEGSKGEPITVNNTVDGNPGYTYWPTDGDYANYGSKDNIVNDAYVRLVTLSSVRELTVASGAADGSFGVISDPDKTSRLGTRRLAAFLR